MRFKGRPIVTQWMVHVAQPAVAVLLVATGGLAFPAMAQSAETDPPRPLAAADSIKETDPDEIVVTGKFQNSLTNRLPVALKELPFTLDVVDRTALDQRGFIRSLEAVATLPNVYFRNEEFGSGAPTFLIRGFLARTFVDGRPQSPGRGAGARDDSFIESAEVLKGPTSIAFGPAAPGGVVNVLTKSPTETDFVALNVLGGSFNTFRGEIDVNQAKLFASDAVRARVTGAIEHSGGPQKEQYRKVYAFRPVVEVDLSSSTRAQLSASYRRVQTREASDFAIYDDGTIPEAFTPRTYFGLPIGKNVGKDLLLEGEVQEQFLDNLRLVVRGSYQDTDFRYRSSSGVNNFVSGLSRANPVGYVYASRGEFSTKIDYIDAQFTGKVDVFGTNNDIVVGVTRQHERSVSTFGFDKVIGVVDVRDPGSTSYEAPDMDFPAIPYFLFNTLLESAYAEVAVRPFRGLTILGGARYDSVKDASRGGPNEPVSTQKVHDVTYRVGGSYALTDHINAYASVASSFIPQEGRLRGGGLIGPETAVNYEVGFKAAFAAGRLKLTGAVFNLLRQNVATNDPTNQIGESFVIATGEQRHRGAELALSGNLSQRLNITLGYGYVDARITKANDESLGRRVKEAPKSTFNVFAIYNFDGTRLEGLRVGGGARAISGRPQSSFGPEFVYPGYKLVDALAGFHFNRSLDIQLNVLNVSNERYLEQTRDTFACCHRFGNPRSVTVSLKTEF